MIDVPLHQYDILQIEKAVPEMRVKEEKAKNFFGKKLERSQKNLSCEETQCSTVK
jgi:hypothetical protein